MIFILLGVIMLSDIVPSVMLMNATSSKTIYKNKTAADQVWSEDKSIKKIQFWMELAQLNKVLIFLFFQLNYPLPMVGLEPLILRYLFTAYAQPSCSYNLLFSAHLYKHYFKSKFEFD